MSPAQVQLLESGKPVSLELFTRVSMALDLRPELHAVDPRWRRRAGQATQDFVHAAMGELEAAGLTRHGFHVAIDEPYQPYQFAGRADVVAWDVARRALLHIENRTAFPNVQEALGSYGAKRAYLAGVLAERFLAQERGWASVTHCVVALWSAEVLHAVRLRTETFRSACPDDAASLLGWWSGNPPATGSVTSTFVVLDPAPEPSRRGMFGTLHDALRVKPRYRDDADAAERLKR